MARAPVKQHQMALVLAGHYCVCKYISLIVQICECELYMFILILWFCLHYDGSIASDMFY